MSWDAIPSPPPGAPGLTRTLLALKLNVDRLVALAQASATASTYTVTTQSASYSETAATGLQVVLITGAAVNVLLPSASGNAAYFIFKLTVAGTLTLTAQSGQTIDGSASASTSTTNATIKLVAYNGNWYVV